MPLVGVVLIGLMILVGWALTRLVLSTREEQRVCNPLSDLWRIVPSRAVSVSGFGRIAVVRHPVGLLVFISAESELRVIWPKARDQTARAT